MFPPRPLKNLIPNSYVTPAPIPTTDDSNPLAYDTPILNQYKNLLSNPPNPNDYAPSRGRRVLAALAGMGAGAAPISSYGGQPTGFRYDPKAQLTVQDTIQNEPFDRAMRNYDLQANNLGKGATVEEKEITNQRLGDVARANEGLKGRKLEIDQQAADVKQQQADIARKKEQDIYETKQKELQQKADKAAQDLAEKQKEFEGKQANFEQQLQVHKLQLEAADATHKLQIAQKDRALEEAKRLHDLESANWDKQRKDAEARIKAAEDAVKARTADKTTTKTESTPGGWFGVGDKSKTTTTTTTSSGNAPKVGDKKTFPNGKVGVFDGKGWVAQ